MIINNQIKNKITKDVKEEFAKLKDELQIYLKPNYDVSQTKKFLKTHIPKEIIYKSEVLLDTVLNYLMEDARKRIKSADIKLQNKFYDMDFRKRIHEWTSQLENKLKLEADMVKYSFDSRLKQGLIVAGVTFVLGLGITEALKSKLVGKIIAPTPSIIEVIISGIITIILSAIAFKISYDKASSKARESIKNDIDNYLKLAEKQVSDWLEKVVTAFEKDFYDFCYSNGFNLEDN